MRSVAGHSRVIAATCARLTLAPLAPLALNLGGVGVGGVERAVEALG